MRFLVASSHFGVTPAGPTIVLVRSTWDDYTYKTTFRAFLWHEPDAPGWVDLGRVKILHETEKLTPVPNEFTELGPEFCSLGQSPQYYESLYEALGDETVRVLTALGDIALRVPARFADHRGLQRSLLRFPDAEAAQKAARQRFGGASEAPDGRFEFTLSSTLHDFPTPHVLHLEFPARNEMLGRIAAIAGRNGTGKTQLLARLGAALCGLNLEDATLDPPVRRHVVAISFNVFDGFTSPRLKLPGDIYRYYGLRAPGAHTLQSEQEPLSADAVPQRPASAPVIDFNWAFEQLRGGLDVVWRTRASFDTWHAMLVELGLDVNEPDLLPQPASIRREFVLDGLLDAFMARLRSASSGHQFLVFVVTALVEGVRRGSIVLLDEIETHVHPYLLSRTLRVLYDFLVKRDAYAVLATHSPVVLQEIPARSVRVVRLDERRPIIKPYPLESLGGSLEDITREGFGVEEDERSYPTILRQLLASAGGDRRAVEEQLPGLGLGARMLLRDLAEESSTP